MTGFDLTLPRERQPEPHRLTENEMYYLRSIHRMLKANQARVKHGPTLHTEALGDNLEWLEMFIESAGRVYDEADLRKAEQKGEEAGYDKAVRDLVGLQRGLLP